MGLIAKHDPVGIDAVISKQQRDLFLELTIKHNWRDYVSYHRAYRNRKDKDLFFITWKSFFSASSKKLI